MTFGKPMSEPAGRIPHLSSGSRLNDLLKRGTTLRHVVVGKSMIVVGAVIMTMIIDQLSGMVRHRIIAGRWELPIVTALRRRSAARARSEAVDLEVTSRD